MDIVISIFWWVLGLLFAVSAYFWLYTVVFAGDVFLEVFDKVTAIKMTVRYFFASLWEYHKSVAEGWSMFRDEEARKETRDLLIAMLTKLKEENGYE